MAFKYYRLLLLLPLLGMKKCEREPSPIFTLPPVTQEGANTLGFVVDGRVWRNYGWLPYTSGESDNLRALYSSRSSTNFTLYAGQISRDVYENFSLSMDSLAGVGTYQLTRKLVHGANRRVIQGLTFSRPETSESYGYPAAGSPATITITRLDTAQHIIAGTFTGTLKSLADTTKAVRITEGRFDVKYE